MPTVAPRIAQKWCLRDLVWLIPLWVMAGLLGLFWKPVGVAFWTWWFGK